MSHSLRVRVRRWHRSAGAVVALFVGVFVVSGILINHAPQLELDQRHVASAWVLDHYGIQIAPPQHGWRIGDNWISQSGGRIYFNRQPVETSEPIISVAALDPMIVIATRQSLLLLSPTGELIEQLDSASLPTPVQAMHVEGEHLLLHAANQWWQSDRDLLQWQPGREPQAQAMARSALPSALAQAIADHARSHELTWLRVVSDIHSGRILGPWGVLLMDAVAVVLGLLAASGLWLWLRTAPRRHH